VNVSQEQFHQFYQYVHQYIVHIGVYYIIL